MSVYIGQLQSSKNTVTSCDITAVMTCNDYPCENGATCIDYRLGAHKRYECECRPGFSGLNCERGTCLQTVCNVASGRVPAPLSRIARAITCIG